MNGEGGLGSMDPLKNPFFECYLRLNQLNFICNRVREEYNNIIQEKETLEENQIIEEQDSNIKEEQSEDSFLSADLSFEENNVDQNRFSEMELNLKDCSEEGIYQKN